MRKLRKKSSGASIRAFFVIPSEGEEWSEWDERHGRTCREVAARESGDETRSISNYFEISIPLRAGDSTRHDKLGRLGDFVGRDLEVVTIRIAEIDGV